MKTMAGDWIKMRMSLRTHPKVGLISSALKADRMRTIGGLHALWAIFDTHTSNGFLPGYSLKMMSDEVGWKGFAEAVAQPAVAWLQETPEGLLMPRFHEHNGQSAKKRAEDSARKQSQRNADKEWTESGQKEPKSGTREEKRREEVLSTAFDPSTSPAGEPRKVQGGLSTSTSTQPQARTTSKPAPYNPTGGHIGDQAEIRAQAKAKADRTAAELEQQRKAAENTAPMPDNLRKFARKAEPEPAAEPTPAPNPETLPDELDAQAHAYGMQRLAFETDDELHDRIQARRALG